VLRVTGYGLRVTGYGLRVTMKEVAMWDGFGLCFQPRRGDMSVARGATPGRVPHPFWVLFVARFALRKIGLCAAMGKGWRACWLDGKIAR